jgi:D-alanyl-D-alanine carboxypeptidase/D-alanyl-D-alanine-endopeptidase (penicillin-binding protein 4)
MELVRHRNLLKWVFSETTLLMVVCLLLAPRFAVSDEKHASHDSLPKPLTDLMQTSGFENGHWGLLAIDAKTREVVYEHNADQLFCPASVTKLFSTSAVLEKLGPDFRFRTPVKRKGEVDTNGTLTGDLILVASGDMVMGGRTGLNGEMLFEDGDHTYGGDTPSLVKSDPRHGLKELARGVLKSGISEIQGNVLIDDRLFPPAFSSGSGPRRVSPITINDNMVDFVVSPAMTAGSPATFKMVPESSAMAVDFQVRTVAADQPVRITIRTLGPRSVTIYGQIPEGHSGILRNMEIQDPVSWARSLFIETLRAEGVKLTVSPLSEQNNSDLPEKSEMASLAVVSEYTSLPLSEYVKVILKVSHNLHASTLPVLLAVSEGKQTATEGLRIQASLLENLGLSPESVSFGGGAGGSRSDLVSPRATVDLLLAMQSKPGFNALYMGLPILGRDGTLAKVVDQSSPARGHVRAKTGTYYVENELTGKSLLTSKALGGYIETVNGRKLAFALFVNNVPTRSEDKERPAVNATIAGKLLGKISEWIYSNCPPGA